MFWFNLAAGLASLLGLVLSVWALFTARDARAWVAAFERHEDAVAALRPLGRAFAEVRELRSSSARVLSRQRCDALADALAELLAADAVPAGEVREVLRDALRTLRQPEVVNSAGTRTWIRDLAVHLATMEAKTRSRTRDPLRRP